ncbi:MAG: helix-turn-helix transcriptional regulator [Imperialibacter sp.]|uniref:PadR family transcriptional regulator n=1 Tax=Imperialibacter sp. TaxID=2038411 RepID=UPI0032EB05FF
MYSKELLKGTLQTIVLKLLAENGRMYGYEITQKVKEQTEGKIQLTEGALYPALHKLEAEGLLVTETINIGKRIRKYYSLTPKGDVQTASKLEEFSSFISTMQFLLNPKTS